jgi:hypothetical protein
MGRPPDAGSTTQNKIMGKVSRSPYSGDSISKQPSEPKAQPVNKVLIYVAVAAAGAVAVMLMRQRQAPATQTGPLVVLTDAVPPDQSNVNNLTQAVLALGASQNGGVATPKTPTSFNTSLSTSA